MCAKRLCVVSWRFLYSLLWSSTEPEEVDSGLLQLCSSQMKLLQLYTDIQQLHSAADTEDSSEAVSAHTPTHTGC